MKKTSQQTSHIIFCIEPLSAFCQGLALLNSFFFHERRRGRVGHLGSDRSATDT